MDLQLELGGGGYELVDDTDPMVRVYLRELPLRTHRRRCGMRSCEGNRRPGANRRAPGDKSPMKQQV